MAHRSKGKERLRPLDSCPKKIQICTRPDIKQTFIKAPPADSCASSLPVCDESFPNRFAVSHTNADASTATGVSRKEHARNGWEGHTHCNCCTCHSQWIPVFSSPEVIYYKLVLSVYLSVSHDFLHVFLYYARIKILKRVQPTQKINLSSFRFKVQSWKLNHSGNSPFSQQ